jgi:DNA-binding transcriptional MocR family regulator
VLAHLLPFFCKWIIESQNADLVNASIGLPNAEYFPYDTLEARVALPDRWSPTEEASDKSTFDANDKADHKAGSSNRTYNVKTRQAESHLLVPHASPLTDLSRKIDLSSALQYGTAQGYPPLYMWIKSFALKWQHPNIPYKNGADVILNCGSTDGFSKVLECFVNTWIEGRDAQSDMEGLLVERFAYMSAVQQARTRGMNITPVEIDAEGMLAEGEGGLRDVLENWDYKKGKRPHLIYTVT